MSLQNFIDEHGQFEVKLRLFVLRRRNGSGILELILANGLSVSVYLAGRHIKILLIYNEALKASKHLENEAARGWLTNEEVASLYVADNPKAIAPEPNVFTYYRSQIHGAIKNKMSRWYPDQTAPRVFYSEKNIGTRLITELEIIDCDQSGRSKPCKK